MSISAKTIGIASVGGSGYLVAYIMNALRLYYFFVFAMYAVVIPHYQIFLRASGYTPAAVGLMIGLFEIAGVLGPMMLGRLADRTGRFRELKVLTTVLAAVAIVFLLLELPFALALLLSAVTGFLFKVSVPLTDAVAGSVLADPREQYGKVRVYGSIGFAVAGVAVPLFSLVDDSDPYSMMVAFVASMALFAIVALLVPPPHRESSRSRESAEGPEPGNSPSGGIPTSFWIVLAAVSFGNIAFGAYNSFFSLYLKEELGVQGVTFYWAIGAVSEIPIMFYSGRLIRRFGIGPLFVASGVIMAARLLLYATAPTIPLVILIQTLHALTFGVMLSTGFNYVNQSTPAASRGAAMAAFNALGIGLAVFVGSVLGGVLVEALGYTGMFAVIALSPAGSAVALLLIMRNRSDLAPQQ